MSYRVHLHPTLSRATQPVTLTWQRTCHPLRLFSLAPRDAFQCALASLTQMGHILLSDGCVAPKTLVRTTRRSFVSHHRTNESIPEVALNSTNLRSAKSLLLRDTTDVVLMPT